MAAFTPTQRRIPCNLGLGALQGRRSNAVYYFYIPSVQPKSTSTVTPKETQF